MSPAAGTSLIYLLGRSPEGFRTREFPFFGSLDNYITGRPKSTTMQEAWLLELGVTPYGEALALQERLVELRLQDRIPDTFLLLQHTPVVTLGRRASGSGREVALAVNEEELGRNGVALFEINRGGLATYHGPGQLVGYPIISLSGKLDLKGYMDRLCRVMSSACAHYGIGARIDKGLWVQAEKIGSTGAAVVSRGGKHVTMHGFAFNVADQSSGFSLIVPCGMASLKVTSLEQLISRQPPLDEVAALLAKAFKDEFRYATLERVALSDLE